MEEGEITNKTINSPKVELIKKQELTEVEEKGIEDEKVLELSKVEDGEIEDTDEEEKMAAESSDVLEDIVPDSIMEENVAIRNDDAEKMMVTETSGIVEERASESTKGEEMRGDGARENIVTGLSDIEREKVLVTESPEAEEGEIEDVDVGEKIVTILPGEVPEDKVCVETVNGEVTCVDPMPEHQDSSLSRDAETREHPVEDKNVPTKKDDPTKMQETPTTVLEDETEDGELDDSSDEKEEKNVENNEPTIEGSKGSSPVEKGGVIEIKNSASRIEFGMDETRPEEEQLDYDEDELEERTKASAPAPAEPSRPIIGQPENKSDGEVDSGSEGEIKSEGEERGDFEDGETRDHPLDSAPEQKKVCKFFEMGNCTWGNRCRYLHPGVNDKGNYDMFSEPPKPGRGRSTPSRFLPELQRPPPPGPFWNGPPSFMPLAPPETAWEKGLRNAKELKKRALQRKVQEPDFLQKREVLSLNVALNEDHDMEFVNHKPLSVNNKGFDPFQDEGDEYATPTPEEVRRQLMQDRQRGAPPRAPPHLHPHEKDHRPSRPEHMMPPDIRRDRRPPSPRHPAADRYLSDMRRMSPRRDNERDRRHDMPPNNPGLLQRHGDRRDRREYPDRSDNRGQLPHDPNRREFPPDRNRNEKFPDGTKGAKSLQNGAPVGHGEQWNDPWARGRPQTKGKSPNKDASSSSTGSSSDSSSRSSSLSSGSSHSSFSGSSRSSSRSSGSSRSSSFSSNRGSSHSPSPSKNNKPKKKVLGTAKQRNALTGAQKKPPVVTGGPPKLAPSKPVPTVKPEQSSGPKSLPVASKKPPDKKPVVPLPNNIPKQAVAKKNIKPKNQTSSSSSEFSRSSDSSPSPSRAKAKSGSDSDSASSSSSSSFSSSSGSSSSDEDDKPTNRRTRKPAVKPPLAPKGQILPSVTVKPTPLRQQNKGKVMVPSKPGRKDVKMTIIDKPGVPKKRNATEMTGQTKKPSSRRTELLEQLRAVEDAIARKRAKVT